MKIRKITSLLLLLSLTLLTQAQPHFPNTMFSDSTKESPNASLADVSWIQGSWHGEAFGGVVEEIWSPPLGNSMMCVFKLVVNNKVKFYEIVTISEEYNTLILRLKHFNADLTGWEEKDETVDFHLVKVTENKVFFDGFTFERISENEINLYVVISHNEEKEEVKFNYRKFID